VAFPIRNFDRPKRIIFDALAARFGGLAYAVVQLAQTLIRDPEMELVIVTRRGSLVDRGLANSPRIRLVRPVAPRRAELLHRVAWETLRLPALVRDLQADALVTFSGILPVDPGCPVVSILANPIPFEEPRRAGSVVRRAAISRTAHRATSVYVPTRHFAELAPRLPHVKVVPLGVDHSLFRPAKRVGTELLYVSDFYRHKRHDLLLDAYERLPADRPALRLVGNPAVDAAWFRTVQARAAGIAGATVHGRIGLRALLCAFENARLFLMPSEHESFSMPLAESLSCGVPAIVRDHPALRETGGDGAVYLRGDDPDAWSRTMKLLLTDNRQHEALRAAALREARRFSWQTMTTSLLEDVYLS
jgi:glycosyltransferase involved in cell wall biosynthesis